MITNFKLNTQNFSDFSNQFLKLNKSRIESNWSIWKMCEFVEFFLSNKTNFKLKFIEFFESKIFDSNSNKFRTNSSLELRIDQFYNFSLLGHSGPSQRCNHSQKDYDSPISTWYSVCFDDYHVEKWKQNIRCCLLVYFRA